MIPDHFTHMNALRVFCIAAEERTITGASQRLNMSPLSVRRQISALENMLEKGQKVQLFTEVEGKLFLTERAERLYISVHKMFEDIQRDNQNDPAGEHYKEYHANHHLRVCTSIVFGSFWLMPLIPEFIARYPHIRLTLITRDDEARLNLNEADVLISWNILQQPLMVTTKIGEGKLRAYASHAYLEKWGTPHKPEDLDHHRLIAFGHNMTELYNDLNPTLWLLSAGRPCNTVREPFFTVNNAHCVLQAIQHGLGIGPLHQYIVPKRSKDLVEILPEQSTPVARYLCYPTYLKHVPAFQAFRDFVIEKISTHPL